MSAPTLASIAAYCDELLATATTPDYSPALNGVQVGPQGPVRKIAAAVAGSLHTIQLAAAAEANLLLVHHGLFWNGLRPVTGMYEARLRALFAHDIAVYSSHLPLDAHATFGNSALLARELGLTTTGLFARHEQIHCGVSDPHRARVRVPRQMVEGALGKLSPSVDGIHDL